MPELSLSYTTFEKSIREALNKLYWSTRDGWVGCQTGKFLLRLTENLTQHSFPDKYYRPNARSLFVAVIDLHSTSVTNARHTYGTSRINRLSVPSATSWRKTSDVDTLHATREKTSHVQKPRTAEVTICIIPERTARSHPILKASENGNGKRKRH